MGPFLPLFRIEVEHAFYAGGRCRGLRFEACAESTLQLARHGCIVRGSGSGIEVHAERFELPPTTWLVQAGAPLFANCTEGLSPRPGRLPIFDGAAAVRDAGDAPATWRLHAEPFVSARDLQSPDSQPIAAALTTAQRRLPPAFIVHLPAIAPDRPDTHGRRWRLRFRARQTTWKYCLLGDWPREPVQIVDLGRDTVFGDPAQEELAGGQLALAIRSSSAIPLFERPAQRFQLRTRGGAEKVLVKRLPVAGPSPLSRETIAGVPMLVSEIHVYR